MTESSNSKDVQDKPQQSIQVSTLKGLVTFVLVLGIIAGGTAGALVATLIQSDGPTSGRDIDLSLNKSQTVVVEQSSLIETIESTSESVVSIIVEKPPAQATGNISNPFFFDIPGLEITPQAEEDPNRGGDVEPEEVDYVQVSAGTGFIVTTEGHILTNKHVVQDKDARYTVITKDGDSYEVEVLGRDPINDLALLKVIDETAVLPRALEVGDSDQIRIGQTVIAIGNSLGEFSHTVTTGIISGIDRRVTAGDGLGFSEVLEEVIQTDAAINPGNSGGPLLNALGQVIGINTAMSQSGQLIGFAIPINDAANFIEDIIEFGHVVRPYMGVRYVLIDERIQKVNDLDVEYGALLRRGDDPSELAVIPGSPADIAGLEENDIILEVDGEQVGMSQSLVRVLSKYGPNDKVVLKVLKNGEEVNIEMTLGEFDEGE
jgi:serine protease Do